MPIAHGEGNYFADDGHARAARATRAAWRSATATRDGKVDGTAQSATARCNAIAGIYSAELNVLGMMPHPENPIEALVGGTDGRGLFAGLVAHFAAGSPERYRANAVR